jgi:phosphoribosyl-AMP cyclohydrolase
MTDLEEGTGLALDFGKLAAVAATGAQVVPVVLQDADSGEVLFTGYANEEALEVSLRERIAVLWSTSRNELWRKGSTSGDVLELAGVRVNCEQNSLLYLVRRTTGGACHTLLPSGAARPGCFYRTIAEGMTLQPLAPLPARRAEYATPPAWPGTEKSFQAMRGLRGRAQAVRCRHGTSLTISSGIVPGSPSFTRDVVRISARGG